MPRANESSGAMKSDRKDRSGLGKTSGEARKGGRGGGGRFGNDGSTDAGATRRGDPNFEGPQDEIKECKIVTVTKDAGGKAKVPSSDEHVDLPASDFLMVKWTGGLSFDVVKNPAFAEGRVVTLYLSQKTQRYTVHKNRERKPRVKREPREDRRPKAAAAAAE